MSPRTWTSRARPLLALAGIAACAAIVLHLVGWSPWSPSSRHEPPQAAANVRPAAATHDDEPDSEVDRRGLEKQLDDLERQIATGEPPSPPTPR